MYSDKDKEKMIEQIKSKTFLFLFETYNDEISIEEYMMEIKTVFDEVFCALKNK